jgi:hypothetical protein
VIEHIPTHDITVLYIPDEILPSTSSIADRVKSLMGEKGLTQVDISMMHGYFDYQVPEGKMIDRKHDSAFYLSITKFFINSGHVHTFSRYDRILSNGSPERLSHGQEEDKGMVECNILGNKYTWKFIANRQAAIFKSFYLTGKTMEDVYTFLDKEIYALPEHSAISIRANVQDAAIINFGLLRRRYPLYRLSKKVLDDRSDIETDQLFANATHDYTKIVINPQNIVDHIVDYLSQNTSQPVDVDRYRHILEALNESIPKN